MASVVQNEYYGNGSSTIYSLTFEYIDQTDVKVSVDNTPNTDWTFANATQIQFNTAPANGAYIRIYRNTEVDDAKATFYPGSTIRAQDLNDNFDQILYVVQEADFYTDLAGVQAEQALATAQSAETKADAAVATANTADTNASNAVSTANSASTAAGNAVTTANSAVSTANSATTTANNAVTTANQAVTDAQAAQAAAEAASFGFTAEYNTPGVPASGIKAVTGAYPIKAEEGCKLPTEVTSTYEEEGAIRYNDSLDKIELYDGTEWKTAAGGASVQSTPPSPASPGDVWYDQDNGRAYVYYNDGDSNQWVEMNPSWNGSGASIPDLSITPAKLSTGGPYWDTSGSVGIGTSSPGHQLTLRQSIAASSDAAPTQIKLENASDGGAAIEFTNAVSGAAKIALGVEGTGGATDDTFIGFNTSLNTTLSEKVRITSAGNVGIGTTSPTARLNVNSGGTDLNADFVGTSSPYIRIDNGTKKYIAQVIGSDFRIQDQSANAERLRIDSSGRLLVGTSTAQGDDTLQIQGDSSGSSASGKISLRRGLSATQIGGNVGADLGYVDFSGNDNSLGARIAAHSDATWAASDYPTRLVFSTTADGASSPTERMRITSQGALLTYSTDDTAFRVANSRAAGTTDRIFTGVHSATSTTTGTMSVTIFTNGDVQNTNNSYGAISDQTLKENIVPANSQWQDLKDIEVVNYNFKEETGHQTHTQLGVIAQQVEAVSPGLVNTDDEGLKSVNYSVLYMKSVKALQEAITRIEALEAEVQALKGGN